MRTNLLSNLVAGGAVQCATVKRLRCAIWLVRVTQALQFSFFLRRRDVDVTASTRRDTRYHASCSLAALSGASNLDTPSRTTAAEDKQEQRFMAFLSRLFGPRSPVGVLMHWNKRAPCAPVLLVPDRSSPFDARALAYLWCPRRPRVARLLAFAALMSPRIVLEGTKPSQVSRG